MRLTVELAGRPTVVDVADDLSSVRLGAQSFPVRVVARGPLRVELDIGGETVVVEGWPEHQAEPPGPIDVNGERHAVRLRVTEGNSGPVPAPPPGPVVGAPVDRAAPVVPAGATAIVPPMPGRVVELRVRDGERVAKGAVLLVLEAMKMRNEVTSPVDGVVRSLAVREGSNVRARETMLVVAPEGPVPPER
ncbi:MAG TPA: biotin/lipoyl-containing protein [Thermoplasmata archaeon]|nr:biotin/lipoyl-containing protein [Thermoplasmata archaeon]